MISFRMLLGSFPALGRPLPAGLRDLVVQVRPLVVTIEPHHAVAAVGRADAEESANDPAAIAVQACRRSGAPPPVRGVIVDPEGLIVTNEHTLESAPAFTVILHDGQRLTATLVGRDMETDIAVLQVEPTEPLAAAVVSDGTRLRVGDWILTVGGPFASGDGMAAGIVSARSRQLWSETFTNLVDANPPVELASFGGPVFDMKGALVGLTSAVFPPNAARVGIGLAIAGTLVRRVIRELREHGRVRRPWLGVSVRPLSAEHAARLSLKTTAGAVLLSVTPDSPAMAAGLRPGDVILRVGGRPVDQQRSLPQALTALSVGQRIPLEIVRQGAIILLEATLGQQPEGAAGNSPDDDALSRPEGRLGLTLAPPSADILLRFAISGAPHGVVVTDVTSGSAAQQSDIRQGDVITEVNLQPVRSPGDVRLSIGRWRNAPQSASILLRLARGDQTRFVSLRLPDD